MTERVAAKAWPSKISRPAPTDRAPRAHSTWTGEIVAEPVDIPAMAGSESSFWKKCSICKKEIAYGAVYQVCNVSTCNRKKTGLVFCTVDCWDAHLGPARHRDAWAEEQTAPKS